MSKAIDERIVKFPMTIVGNSIKYKFGTDESDFPLIKLLGETQIRYCSFCGKELIGKLIKKYWENQEEARAEGSGEAAGNVVQQPQPKSAAAL